MRTFEFRNKTETLQEKKKAKPKNDFLIRRKWFGLCILCFVKAEVPLLSKWNFGL